MSLQLSFSATLSDFKSNEDAFYKCKWHCPLDRLQVVEPDFLNDIWEHFVKEGEGKDSETRGRKGGRWEDKKGEDIRGAKLINTSELT